MNFDERVWKVCQKIPKGKVTTYKAIAQALNSKAYRAVGNALNRNPYGILNCKSNRMVPCHRVVDSNGHLHGFAHGLKKKELLLKREGIEVREDKIVNFQSVVFKF